LSLKGESGKQFFHLQVAWGGTKEIGCGYIQRLLGYYKKVISDE
jgi:hypothetical protein